MSITSCYQIINMLITSCIQIINMLITSCIQVYKYILRLSRCFRPDVLRPNDQLVDPEVYGVEREPGVGPELAEVHVEREVHVLQNQRSMSKVKIYIRIKIR